MTILRDLSLRAANGNGILGTNLVGLAAAQVAKGFALAGLLENHIDAGDPVGCLYRVEAQAILGSDDFSANEDGSFSALGLPNGSQTVPTKLYKNNVADAGSIVFNVGTSGSPGGDPLPSGDIDISLVSAGRIVLFEGSGSRVVVF